MHFDSNQKIQQIRLYWDQGSLLKLVDVIGSRARNWPIRDGKDQARLIASSAATASQGKEHTRNIGDVTITSKASSPKKNGSGDPHTSLSLFSPREPNHEYSNEPPAVPPRTSAKPPPRDYYDLFAGGESDDTPKAELQASSPKKDAIGAVAPKGGAGKNFQPSRLFDTDESPLDSGMSQQSPEQHIRVDPTKYNHFEFSDENEQPIKQGSKLPDRSNNKHQSQWGFEDFSTPEKVTQKFRAQDVRHFDTGDDDSKIAGPPKENNTIQPRRDAQTHFDFEDAGTPAGERRPAEKLRGRGSTAAIGLYQNNLYDDTELPPSPEKKNHRPIAVANLKDRRKDFDPHFELADPSPSLGEKSASDTNRPLPGNHSKVAKMMEAQWETTDESPHARSRASHGKNYNNDPSTLSSKDKENYSMGGNNNKNRYMGSTSIKTGGDGMGGKRGTDYEYMTDGRGIKDTAIKTGGDGMGGKKGAGRNWGFGDESDEDGVGGANGGKFQAGKRQQGPKDSGLWDV